MRKKNDRRKYLCESLSDRFGNIRTERTDRLGCQPKHVALKR